MERSETRAQHRATIVIGYRSRYCRDICMYYEIIIKCVLFSVLKLEPNQAWEKCALNCCGARKMKQIEQQMQKDL